jgi:shikimate dehydrogenase
MKKTCVIGWPIAHSRSPLIHGYWIRKYGLKASYTKEAIQPERLPAFVRSLQGNGFVGCNVTLPHKEAVYGLVDEADILARRLGAVNTIYVRDGLLMGTNTDGEGFLSSLTSSYPDFDLSGKTAVIIGAGGSARAVIGALLDAGVSRAAIINRTASRVTELLELFGSRVFVAGPERMSSCDLLIHATSQGMEGQASLSFDLTLLKPTCIVADLIYTPLKTELLAAAESRGLAILPGLGMLLHQAVRGFELWHGIRPEVTQDLYDLVAADVAKARIA